MSATEIPGRGVESDAISQPVLPAYGGACIASVTRALLRIVCGSYPRVPGAATAAGGNGGAAGGNGGTEGGSGEIPDWVPAPARDASQVVLLVLDGLGWEQLQNDPALAPTLTGGAGGKITSVAPTTTATCLTSISTGLVPAEHGVVGYRLAVEDTEILNVLKWRTGRGDARTTIRPREFQPHPAFGGYETTEVTRSEFRATGFTAAHLDGARLVGWQVPSTLVVEVRRLLRENTPFIEAYYDGLDKVAHEHGIGEHYDAELRFVDRMVADLIDVLPAGACLVVTSDHGQVNVGRSVEMPANEVLDASRLISGEGRFRWFHAHPGAEKDLEAAASGAHGHNAWVRTLEQMLDEGWFGGALSKRVASRVGDVALVAREPVAFLDPADTGETRLAARHGSLTPTEMYVPLLGFERN
ncbi:MAG: alkaline phosphatase family protein [Acidimicrobiales bacterium]